MEVAASVEHVACICHARNVIKCFCALNQNTCTLDLRDSDHTSSNQSALYDQCPLERPIVVNLPNGRKVNVTHQEKLKVNSDLILNCALLIPNFKFNLL